MTVPEDQVEDDEQLYRSVRSVAGGQQCYRIENGRTVFTVAAFLDREKKPSVDRAKLQDFNPSRSRFDRNDGIVELVAANIRAIGLITQTKDKTRSQHAVDIVPDPIKGEPAKKIAENPAHAVITTQPPLTSGKAFERLKEALARVATDAGWCIEPETPLRRGKFFTMLHDAIRWMFGVCGERSNSPDRFPSFVSSSAEGSSEQRVKQLRPSALRSFA